MNTERFLDACCVNLVQAGPSGPTPGGYPVPVTPLTTLGVPDGGDLVGNLQGGRLMIVRIGRFGCDETVTSRVF